jgi:Cu(I)-responsive transcriptional regulator
MRYLQKASLSENGNKTAVPPIGIKTLDSVVCYRVYAGDMDKKEDFLSRGTLASQSGVHAETIRFYENKGLLPTAHRSPSGYRQFTTEHLRRLSFIKRSQELGFTLQEILELLSLKAIPHRNSRKVKKLTEEKIQSVSLKIQDLQRMKKNLIAINEACDGQCETGDCPILQALDGR